MRNYFDYLYWKLHFQISFELGLILLFQTRDYCLLVQLIFGRFKSIFYLNEEVNKYFIMLMSFVLFNHYYEYSIKLS